MESNSYEKFIAIVSLLILRPYFRGFFKKRFLRKFSKPGHGNLVLLTSTAKVDLSNLNFNFDDRRTNFLQVLTYHDFSRLLSYDARQNRTEQN